jgi:hypothetical protein
MNMNTVFIRAAIATAFVGLGFTSVHVPQASAAQDAVSMSVDARAPMHATLLPTISVNGDAGNPDGVGASRVEAGEALSVTLLPTVYVTARLQALVATLHPSNAMPVVAVDYAVPQLPRVSAAHDNATPALRARVMPR